MRCPVKSSASRASPSAIRIRTWGSNSQWGTDFRRDYIVDGTRHYIVDRTNIPPRSDNLLGVEYRLDLLRHRCSLRTDFGADQWPYDDTFVEPSPK
jgi:hypothetical protein